MNDLRGTGQLTEISLGPLDAVETAELGMCVAGRDLDQNEARRLYDETEGQPLYVVETVRAGLTDNDRAASAEPQPSTLGGAASQQVRTFGTMTRDLLTLAEWLRSEDISHVAMESTGVFWQPIYNVLEDAGLDVLVANARHIKAVPGRKTDVKDAEWIADLLRHGLIRGSAIPNRARRELRELVRYRLSLSRQRAQVAHRIRKVLEGANIKLS